MGDVPLVLPQQSTVGPPSVAELGALTVSEDVVCAVHEFRRREHLGVHVVLGVHGRCFRLAVGQGC